MSSCGRYRWHLARTWAPDLDRVAFIGLNPSTADATTDDPTLRRCMGFARRWGLGGVDLVNLYAFRATRPADLWRADEPIGTETDAWIDAVTARAAWVVAAWGNHGARGERAADVLARQSDARCLGLTRQHQPRHPLYVPYDAAPAPLTLPRVSSTARG